MVVKNSKDWEKQINGFRTFLLVLSLSLSFGGFTFYAAVVVPVASDVLDSTVQGFVTRRITTILNVMSAVTAMIFLVDSITMKRVWPKSLTINWAILLFIYMVCLLTLFALHPQLDSMLDKQNFLVFDEIGFYKLHRIYLWVSTLQWLATMGMIWIRFGAMPNVPK